MITVSLVTLCLGLAVYFWGTKLNNGNPPNEPKKTLADYHGEITLAGVVFLILSFVSFSYWLWLNFIVAKR